MKILTYVDGILSVTNGINNYSEKREKPSFITGDSFYYEPTLCREDGKLISKEKIEQAILFIDSFIFNENDIDNSTKNHLVDSDGNYIGFLTKHDEYTIVDSEPSTDMEKWNGTEWIDSVLIDSNTKAYIGTGDTRSIHGTEYAPLLVNKPFSLSKYKYINNKWTISLIDAKKDRLSKILEESEYAISEIIGSPISGETSSFEKQEKEARGWNINNEYLTPFIDILLVSRNRGETKKELVDKIIQNSNSYMVLYASHLGKFQSKSKEIDIASSVDEVDLVKW